VGEGSRQLGKRGRRIQGGVSWRHKEGKGSGGETQCS